MAKKHLKNISVVGENVKIEIDLTKFSERIKKAQFELDGDVMNSMIPFMPMITGQFVDVTRAASAAMQGTGKVYAAFGPQGRYLYEGKVMVNAKTGKGPMKIPTGPGEYVLRFPKGSKLVATNRPLRYTNTAHPEVTDHWFDAAKKRDLSKWLKKAREIIGGNHGR